MITISWPWPRDKYLNLPPPQPYLSANFISSEVGSDPGLSMKTIGIVGVLCSKINSKLMCGGVMYSSPMMSVM